MPYTNEIKQIIEIGRRLYDKGFIAGVDGNLSIRLNSREILITATGISKGFLVPEDVVIVDYSGKTLSGDRKPSSEMKMHLAVYNGRENVHACCHAHPPYATAFSVVEKILPPNILPEVILTLGQIPLVEYAPPGTAAVPRALEKYLKEHDGFILTNHGVLTLGRNLFEAFYRMETVEHYAKIIYIAEQSGKLNFLDLDEVRRLEKLRESLGTQTK
ncbi:MAG: class II aldolase/adducin family protein [bacterium]|jgi:L-fuculose-phosphate aldolase